MIAPFANLFAAHCADRAALDALARDLRESGEFTEVCQPVAGWVLAVAALPETESDGKAARALGLAFAEGRDEVRRAARAGDDPDRALVDRLLAAPDSLAAIHGDFGFVHLRPHGEALIVRSCGGLVPFYACTERDRCAIATRLGDFARFWGQNRLDPLVNACWASGELLFPDARTFLDGVSIVPSGCHAELGPNRMRSRRYWDPRQPELGAPQPREHAERLRAVLIEQLERGLDPRGGNLLLLSGGVDSSALAAVARRALDLPLMTLSFIPEADHPAHAQELAFLANLEHELGFARSWQRPFSRERYLDLIASAPPSVFYLLHPALGVIPELARETTIRTVCGGEFADEVCGSSLVMADWAYHTSLRQLLGAATALPTGPRDLGRWVKHRVLRRTGKPRWPPRDDLPEPIAQPIREEYAEWFARERRAALADRRPHATLAAYAAVSNWNVMNWEALSPLGIRRVYPFFNRAALELAFECHPLELFGPGMKTLLRRAVSDLVPPRNLLRADKGQWGHRTVEWVKLSRTLPRELAPVVREDWLAAPPERVEWNHFKIMERITLFSRRLSQRSQRQNGRPMGRSSAGLTLE